MSKKLVQRGTNMVFALLPDGTVAVEDPATGQSGVFERDGTRVSGDLSYADQVMLDYVAGAYIGPDK
ncbi:hypothetical protein CBI38_22340 [Rhodococcus oxybenzonivorans]|uniref:Uncharacterized protein n=1 Tax=Rhodococcus oxybenzonivorans TaxID=1990687 RepID=A0A2S2BZ29_9NOCA|nr:hypothetical protein [Rhodococcus oxybenzonivorans]AWK73890.1 hypothetical protein CBI38_22340 [Rhodococcus oxybenzonivorans]